jgi:MFS family permease
VVYGMETVLLVVVARHLGLGAAGYGWLLAAVGAGGVAATLGAGRLITTARPRSVLVGSLLVLAAAGALTGLTPVLPLVLLWSVLAGAAAIIVEVLAETALQRQLEEDVFARAYGIAFPLSIGGIVVGSLVAAPLLSVLGLPGALLAMAAVAGGYALVVACSGAPVAVPAEVRSATAAGADGVAPA